MDPATNPFAPGAGTPPPELSGRDPAPGPNQWNLLKQIRSLILRARATVARSVDHVQTWTNYRIGRLIVENEQKGNVRAEYAEKIIVSVSRKLTAEFGRGFSKRNLEYMRQFYFCYYRRIAQSPIAQSDAVPFKLSWTHYLFLMALEDPDERSFYEIEAASQNWSVRELKRQFNASLYERLALSRNKSRVLELARKGQIVEKPEDAMKEPYVLEFLGLSEKEADIRRPVQALSAKQRAASQTGGTGCVNAADAR